MGENGVRITTGASRIMGYETVEEALNYQLMFLVDFNIIGGGPRCPPPFQPPQCWVKIVVIM